MSAMRDDGYAWSEIAHAVGGSVSEARQAVHGRSRLAAPACGVLANR
jgi:hypothetical protein